MDDVAAKVKLARLKKLANEMRCYVAAAGAFERLLTIVEEFDGIPVGDRIIPIHFIYHSFPAGGRFASNLPGAVHPSPWYPENSIGFVRVGMSVKKSVLHFSARMEENWAVLQCFAAVANPVDVFSHGSDRLDGDFLRLCRDTYDGVEQ